jgi:hypothetical protein
LSDFAAVIAKIPDNNEYRRDMSAPMMLTHQRCWMFGICDKPTWKIAKMKTYFIRPGWMSGWRTSASSWSISKICMLSAAVTV